MAHHQQGDHPRNSAVQGLINMLRIPSTSNMPSIEEDEAVGDTDEPPDDHQLFKRVPTSRVTDYNHAIISPLHPNDRRESLLTRALMTSPEQSPDTTEFPALGHFPRRTTTASSHSNISVPSTAELTSDGGITSPERSNPPSPPAPTTTFHSGISKAQPQRLVIADEAKAHPPVPPPSTHESTVEANLGRKRCITFACGRKTEAQKAEAQKAEAQKKADEAKAVAPTEPPKRKCMLTFACPTRATQNTDTKTKEPPKQPSRRHPSPAPPVSRKPRNDSHSSPSRKSSIASDATDAKDFNKSEKTRFHEFAVSHNEEDEWVNESTVEKPKITVNDCMKKELAIRKIGEEAEEEARQDEEEEEEEENAAAEDDDDDDELGFSSDDGNESDNEEGFADSDDESDAGSDYHFWAPSTTTAATSTDQLEHIRPGPHRTTSETSLDSLHNHGRIPIFQAPFGSSKRRVSKLRKFRPGTPDLPDSTDFVCGTLDEDRPLEAAYISCMAERKRSKHIPIPQDIDPSFPTTDPEEEEDENDDYDIAEDSGEPLWLKGGMEGIDESAAGRGRRRSTEHTIKSSSHSPMRRHSPAPKPGPTRRSPPPPMRKVRSPPPTKRIRSPPPTKRLRSPAPQLRVKSPAPTRRPSMTISPSRQAHALRITGRSRGCELVHTKSLPRTPNPFFARQLKAKEEDADAEALSPKNNGVARRLNHTRGPIDIVEGLEKKRQKRREKFWRQHCRKAAKEQMERKPVPGKGAERMKELGLEVAERCKGYGLGQPAQLVISI